MVTGGITKFVLPKRATGGVLTERGTCFMNISHFDTQKRTWGTYGGAGDEGGGGKGDLLPPLKSHIIL
jgi:hypothetical protein